MYPRSIAPNNLRTVFDSTADDSDKSWVVPDDEIWRLNWAHLILVSTATVGNRQILMRVDDPNGNMLFDTHAGNVQAASVTRHYLFLQGIYRETSFVDGELQVPFPQDCWLGPGFTLRFYDATAVDAAADDMTVTFQVDRIQTNPAYSTS